MKFLEKKLKTLGFKTKSLEFREKNNKPVKNLYARLGNKGPNFCYAGHLDVVPAGDLKNWTVNPFKSSVKKGYLIGRGANDMKSSVAAFVSAVSNFVLKNRKFSGSISLLITGDEEGDAVNGTKKVVEYLKRKKEKIMCGRYKISKPVSKTVDLVKTNIKVEDTDNYNAHPSQKLPIIKSYTNGKALELCEWGLVPGWSKKLEKFSELYFGS